MGCGASNNSIANEPLSNAPPSPARHNQQQQETVKRPSIPRQLSAGNRLEIIFDLYILLHRSSSRNNECFDYLSYQ
jgi:hypothetical protein